MGIASGRVVLAWLLANRVGEKTFAILLLVLASGMLGVMYVRSFVVDAVALALVGFFFGPVTPKVLDVIGVRVPPSLKASVVSLLVGLGASLALVSLAVACTGADSKDYSQTMQD